MYAFAVLGDDAEEALARLFPELDGRVGAVRTRAATTSGGDSSGESSEVSHDGGEVRNASESPARTESNGVATVGTDTEFVLDDGRYTTGEGLSVEDALDGLAPDHEYGVVLGTSGTDLPEIVVGTVDSEPTAEDPLAVAEDAIELDVEAAVEAVHGTDPYETLESLVADVKRSSNAEYAGAIATFTGRVRPRETEDDDRTRFLEFEKYEGIAEERMWAIETELEDRDGVLDVRLHHRTGRVAAGEDIVFVVVLAGHRSEAFDAVEDGIDRLKDEVPLFKKEVTGGDTFWVHERET